MPKSPRYTVALTFLLVGFALPAYSVTLSVLPGGDISLRDPVINTYGTIGSGTGGAISIIDPNNASIIQLSAPGGTTPLLISPVSDGSDSIFHPTQSINLTLVPDAVFNFSTITIGPSITVGFERNGSNAPIYFLATSDILINGMLNGGSGPLYLSTPGTITLNGNLYAQEIILSSNQQFVNAGNNQPISADAGNLQLVAVPIPPSGALLIWALGTMWIPHLSRRLRHTAVFNYFRMPSRGHA